MSSANDHDRMVERLRTLSDADLRALGRAVARVEAERAAATPRPKKMRRRRAGAAGPVERRGIDAGVLLAALLAALLFAGFLVWGWQFVRAAKRFVESPSLPHAVATGRAAAPGGPPSRSDGPPSVDRPDHLPGREPAVRVLAALAPDLTP